MRCSEKKINSIVLSSFFDLLPQFLFVPLIAGPEPYAFVFCEHRNSHYS
uniref:CSON007546 protein n=1 Tax=Culicoides sonorensis TaxID=179676 RepID=A0A336MYF0_CULSO